MLGMLKIVEVGQQSWITDAVTLYMCQPQTFTEHLQRA